MTVAQAPEDHGYRVAVTHDGLEALDAESTNPSDILITDLRMPNLDGNALVHRIRTARPDLPVLVMTGYSEVLPSPEPGRLMILRKPFHPDHLLDTVKRLLETTPPSSPGRGKPASRERIWG